MAYCLEVPFGPLKSGTGGPAVQRRKAVTLLATLTAGKEWEKIKGATGPTCRRKSLYDLAILNL